MNMKKFWGFLLHGMAASECVRRAPIGPIAAQHVKIDEGIAYPLFVMHMSARMKLDRCREVLGEIRDLGDEPITMELRIAVKECLREIEKQEESYATDR